MFYTMEQKQIVSEFSILSLSKAMASAISFAFINSQIFTAYQKQPSKQSQFANTTFVEKGV